MTGTVTAADYRGEVITGKRWRRAYEVHIRNPYRGQATVAFDEEEVTSIDGTDTSRPTTTLSAAVDLADQIPLFDPATGEPTGEVVSQGQAYVTLYSMYRKLAAERDLAGS